MPAQARRKLGGALALVVAWAPSFARADAPRAEAEALAQHRLAEIHDAEAARTPVLSAAHAEAVDRACAVRLGMTRFVGESPWHAPGATTRAELVATERLVLEDLHRCGAARTNLGRELADWADAATGSDRRGLLLRAAGTYGLAVRDWKALLDVDPAARDASETRYFLAEAWVRHVELEEAAGGEPSDGEVDAARVAARSAAADAKRAAAFLLPVRVADLALRSQYRRHARSHGTLGFAKRDQVPMEGEHAVRLPLPRQVAEAIAARDAYVKHVGTAEDRPRRDALAYEAAELELLYGRIPEARERFTPLFVPGRCDHADVAYLAWRRLEDIAAVAQDIATARALAEQNAACREVISCPGPGPMSDAYALFRRAERARTEAESRRSFGEAGDAYRVMLEHAPLHDDAPEAALNGAYAYKQAGRYGDARALLELFLRTYAAPAELDRLARSNPRKYAERWRYAQQAATDLAVADVMLVDLRAAADRFEAIAADGHADQGKRREAATNAAILRTHLGEDRAALAARNAFVRLAPKAVEVADLDQGLARTRIARWDERAPDVGSNRAARLAAIAAMEGFLAAYRGHAEALPFVTQVAHLAAKVQRAGNDPRMAASCREVATAFARLPSDARRGTQAEVAAECAAWELEALLPRVPAVQRARHAPASAILQAFASDTATAATYARRLADLRRRFDPGAWLAAALAREAAFRDATRAALALAYSRSSHPRIAQALGAATEDEVRVGTEALALATAHHASTPELDAVRHALSRIARRAGGPGPLGMVVDESGELLSPPVPTSLPE